MVPRLRNVIVIGFRLYASWFYQKYHLVRKAHPTGTVDSREGRTPSGRQRFIGTARTAQVTLRIHRQQRSISSGSFSESPETASVVSGCRRRSAPPGTLSHASGCEDRNQHCNQSPSSIMNIPGIVHKNSCSLQRTRVRRFYRE